jgi:oligoribonuclease NrnB/cAMP/cGMP phosphodiesterase (DHH superfamily)
MKPLVIYHGGQCTDGFGAAFAAWLNLGDEAEYVPMDYLKATDGMAEFHERVKLDCSIGEREVYILDFSLPKAVMDWLFSHAKRVVWLDHHASVFKDWGVPLDDVADELTLGLVQPNDHTVVLDNNKSGALLAWEYFHPGTEVPMLIRHIDDYDRWQFKMRGTKEIARAIRSYQYGSMCTEGGAILRAHNQNVQAVLKQARPTSIRVLLSEDGFAPVLNGLATNAPSFLASDLGHELANKSGTFGLVWSMAGNGQIHCSMRSNGGYDVSAIAKAFGGGGHRNAAGFSTDIDTLMSWLR